MLKFVILFLLMIFVYVMSYFTSQRRMSRDWETAKMLSHETVHRNRIKLVATEKALNSHKCLITLYIVGWVIILNVNTLKNMD